MITTAYSELTRVLPWSLRALGYSFPVADRGAYVLATAAALDPSVLQQADNWLPRSIGENDIEFNSGRCTVDVSGRSIVEIGPALMDFIGSELLAYKCVEASVVGASQLEILPAILVGAVDYGLTALGVVQLGNQEVWCLATSLGDSRYVKQGGDRSELESIFALMDVETRPVEANSNKASGSSCLIIATRGCSKAVAEYVQTTGVNADTLIAKALKEGIAVSTKTLEAIYALEKKTWAPTSERSRAQAGFTVMTGGAA